MSVQETTLLMEFFGVADIAVVTQKQKRQFDEILLHTEGLRANF